MLSALSLSFEGVSLVKDGCESGFYDRFTYRIRFSFFSGFMSLLHLKSLFILFLENREIGTST